MTIIMCLQGLDAKAGVEDIRKFFECLHIPNGGVYIVGGQLSEAFIAFNTERDSQLALSYTGRLLKGSKVTLRLSSMAELECKLKSHLKRMKPSIQLKSKEPLPSKESSLPHSTSTDPRVYLPTDTARPCDPRTAKPPNAPSVDTNTAFILGMCTVLQSLQSHHQTENNVYVPKGFQQDGSTLVSTKVTPGYVRLFGLPASTTKADICQFFSGLKVQEVIVNVKLGVNHCCLVKFADQQAEHDALLFNQQCLGPICVEVRGATERMWISALQECEN
ncbi:RNA binding motif protein 12Ba [Aulostomus maculatus]